MIRCFSLALTLCLSLALVGCFADTSPVFRPIEKDAALFWVRFTTETGDLLGEIVKDFNAQHQGPPIKADYIGGYAEIFRKVSAGIQARALPTMAVAYESMTTEYIEAGAVAPLDEYVNSPEVGFSAAELEDFFPSVLETNRYEEYGGTMYSFPFAKSLLLLYFNREVMGEAGIEAPPVTWEEFLGHCRQIKAKTGKFACAITVDCSTIDGFIFSMGGEVARGRETLYASRESLRVFQLIETLAKEKLAYQVPPGSYDDDIALAQGRIAYTFRTSSARQSLDLIFQGARERWGMAMIPQADPVHPRTVLYGPNICIFRTAPELERAAWEFTRYFTSPEVSVKWSLGTGYLPIRKSAAGRPEMQAFWAEWPYNRVAFDCLPYAKAEPNIAGWQAVRELVEDAETAVLTGVMPAGEAVKKLKREADAVLAGR